MSNKKGLPKLTKMRHDYHFVDEISSQLGKPLGRMILVSKIKPNPDQPRTSSGDLTELKASIKEKGILEPILVRHIDGIYQIISGERRYTAAKELGMEEVPCIVLDASDEECMEISLIENLQRKDLSPFEEADGLMALCKRFSYTHEEIAKKIGKSRTTITESLTLATIPPSVRELCNKTGVTSKSMLLQIARQDNEDNMKKLLISITRDGLSRDTVRAIRSNKKSVVRTKNYVFKYSPKDRRFFLQLKFNKPHISLQEIKKALKSAIEFLESKSI